MFNTGDVSPVRSRLRRMFPPKGEIAENKQKKVMLEDGIIGPCSPIVLVKKQ